MKSVAVVRIEVASENPLAVADTVDAHLSKMVAALALFVDSVHVDMDGTLEGSWLVQNHWRLSDD